MVVCLGQSSYANFGNFTSRKLRNPNPPFSASSLHVRACVHIHVCIGKHTEQFNCMSIENDVSSQSSFIRSRGLSDILICMESGGILSFCYREDPANILDYEILEDAEQQISGSKYVESRSVLCFAWFGLCPRI